MRRTTWVIWAGVLAMAGGCYSAPPLDNPALVQPGAAACPGDNPILVVGGVTPEMYRKVFETALTALTDFGFGIAESNVHDGRIETLPRLAPGLLQPLAPGSPDYYDRLLSTLQCYRHRAQVLIEPSANGGYFIRVTVLKELEDLPKPQRATTGGALFRAESTVERQYTVIDPTVFESNWIPRGRDCAVEQEILARIRRCL